MCGIAGCLDLSGRTERTRLQRHIATMTETLRHRGPDDSGLWLDPNDTVALGHSRLAVLDLSDAGHQPMESRDRRLIVAFNGEIYNFEDLRDELLSAGSPALRGHSDTEVLVAAFSAWGIENTIEQLNGMFAIAIWDRTTKELTLARDRFGEKPLYYIQQGPWFCFASELKAIARHAELSLTINASVIPAYIASAYVPDERCIYNDVHKVTPGSILNLSLATGNTNVKRYWSAAAAIQEARNKPFQGTREDAVAAVGESLRRAVRLRMVSDVPLGSLLSGGIDSSLVTAMMQAEHHRPVRTFTVGFPGTAYDEAPHARAVAGRIGAGHVSIPASPDDILPLVSKLPIVYDEPFADSSQLPSLLVAGLARQHVKVVVTGDGGDELFAGYNRYRWALRADGRASFTALKVGATLVGMMPARTWGRLEYLLYSTLGDRLPFRNIQTRSRIVSTLSRRDSFERRYELLTLNHELVESLYGGRGDRSPHGGPTPSSVGALHWMMYSDSVGYLPGDILVKLDRASMGVGLEARLPYLDHHLAELAWSLPDDLLIRNGRGKWILRTLLARHLGPELCKTAKRGFSVPLDAWLRGPLREWAGDFLSPSLLARHMFFDPAVVTSIWSRHLTGQKDCAALLWPVLMFNAWYSSIAN